MTPPNAKNALHQYGQVGKTTDVAYASPHRLIQMLMEGALEKIAVAKGAMERGDINQKGSFISWAISIIEGLRVSLDPEAGGEIAANLESLYDYMERQLVLANAQNDATLLDEVAVLMRQIKSGWDAIPAEVQAQHGQSAVATPDAIVTAKS